MDTPAGEASEGLSEAGAGAHVGRQLYTQGVGALTNAAAVAKGAITDLGDGPFGRALKRTWRPADQLGPSMDEIREFHAGFASQLNDAIDMSISHYRPRFEAALTGAAGDALLHAHDSNIRLWSTHQDMHERAATAAAQALMHIRGLQGRIDSLAEAGEEEFNKAVRNRNPIAAMEVWTRYNRHAEESTAESTHKATSAIHAANFTIPLDITPDDPPRKEEGRKPPEATPSTDGSGRPPEATPGTETGPVTAPAGGPGGRSPKTTPSTQTGPVTPPTGGSRVPQTTPSTDGIGTPPAPRIPPVNQMPQAVSGAMGRAAGGGGGGGAGGGGSALSGLGSGLKPAGLGSGMPASSLPAPPPAAPSAPSSMAGAGSSFQSGLASGMAAVAPVEQPVAHQAMAAQQPLVGSPMAGSGPAGVPVAPHGVPDGGAGPAQGGAGPVSGGAPMMPPAAMGGGGPLAPYSAPGSGAPSGGGAAPSAPAAGGQASSAGGGGLAPPGPVLAGGAGSGSAMGGVAGSVSEVSADMLLVQRVLGGLVRGCEFWPAPIAWAVGMVKTPVGSQVVVANSVGGGGYLPPRVFLPSTARLAVVDPALPFGWAQRWMGCQRPSKILADHVVQLSKRVAGASISAMVTTEVWPVAPAGVGEFVGVQHRQALGMLSAAPVLDGAHQHRLTALDPGLAQRVSVVDAGGDVSVWAAAQVTAAVIQAAAQPDATGEQLVTADEVSVLQAVHRGAADEMTWNAYDQAADQRHNGALVAPDSHAPLDHDESELTESLTRWYRHYYQCGRIVEMVRAWKASPPPLAEIAYCGVQAGFGSVVTAMISGIEQQLAGRGRSV